MRTRPRVTSCVVVSAITFAACATTSSTVFAAEKVPLAVAGTGADTHLFRPSVDSKGFLSVNGADIVGHLDFSTGLVLDYGYGLLPTTEGKHGEDGQFLLQHSFQGTLQLDMGLANFVVIGIALPVVLAGHETVEDIGPTGGLYTSQANFAQGLEFVALNAKVRIIRPLDKPSVGLAGILQGGIGVSGADNLVAENGGFVWPQLAFEGRATPGGALRVGVNAGFRANFGGTPARYGVDAEGIPILAHGVFEYGQLITAGLGLSGRVVGPLDLVAETYSSILVTGENALAQRVSAEALGGLKVFIDGKSFLYLGAGPGYAPGFETATARGTLGFVFEPSIGDRDQDGIKDDVDKCPDQREDIDGFEDADGCPDPDNDKDGVLDIDDDCPDVPGEASNRGCPVLGDKDDDGVPDALDACPAVAGTKSGDPKTNGCPPVIEGPRGPVIIGDHELFLVEKVQFKTASATILPESNWILDAVAKTLQEHGEFTLVEIQGHADERGGEAYNLGLTKARAKSVMDALLRRRVDPKRLRSMGFGPYCPSNPGHDETAWNDNRRVEFKIVRDQGEPTGIELGCEAAKTKGVQSPPP